VFFGLLVHLIRRLRRRARSSRLQGRGEFDCSVRMVDGSLPGEGKHWKSRVSRAHDGVLQHGEYEMQLLLNRECDEPGGSRLRYEARI
jgi:hypothetical protein